MYCQSDDGNENNLLKQCFEMLELEIKTINGHA